MRETQKRVHCCTLYNKGFGLLRLVLLGASFWVQNAFCKPICLACYTCKIRVNVQVWLFFGVLRRSGTLSFKKGNVWHGK